MSAKKLYAAVAYKRSSMQRQIVEVSHSIKALRRRHSGHIFAVEQKAVPGSRFGLKEYTIVGKAITEAA